MLSWKAASRGILTGNRQLPARGATLPRKYWAGPQLLGSSLLQRRELLRGPLSRRRLLASLGQLQRW